MKVKNSSAVISEVEVSNISRKGIWILLKGKEYFLPYDRYPWFKGEAPSRLRRVTLSHGHHLRWQALDVDVELESLESPEKYPLIYR